MPRTRSRSDTSPHTHEAPAPPQQHIGKGTETTSVKCATREAHSPYAHGATSFGTQAVSSCLHPIPPFPIRTQDAIVCGQACWLELTEALRQEGMPHPTAEHKTTRQLLPRSLNTTNTTHSFPLVTYPTAKTPVQQRTSVERADDVPDSRPTPKRHRITSPTKKRARDSDPPEPLPKKSKPTPRGTNRKRATSIQVPKKPGRRKKQKLSPHINPWTINSGRLRRLSAQDTLVDRPDK
jgi:hypothetical protein